ncbi:hypothetical protein, variant 1 [Aphanomyces astaci]|uniref:U2A'/phosphoprotein 32 family A C-terminal domain-containing protein n=1 Tax=Aphanomyces astaci TaxID=112090 RepID=W4HCJ3_APHAT|nr:hypothetical protein, variant 1 [Aphanomyces astaci]ETV89705.1 hypothetical protein, variant 1 [Aphanomyces astaci]|eukprot:XP_009822105.1 hypothetical protein, variant 1 [Aphanomyces astaci]
MSCQSHVNRNIVSIAADVATDNDAAVEVLNLHGNCIRSMDGLQRFTNLKELSLSSNWINCPSFAALRGLVHLTVLNLSANRITTTIGFPVLPSLCELSLAYNSLTVLDGLLDPLKFPALEILDLRDNQIADVSALSPLFYLQTMRALRLQSISKSQSNPVCAAEGYPSMLLDRMSTLETLDGEHVSVLKELAALVMPKYTSVARTFRQPPTLESAPPTPRRRQSIEPDWTVLDARLRLLEAHQTHEEPFMDDIDSQIHQATSSLRSMHKQTLETRVPPPPMSVFVETKQRRGYHVHTPPPHERDSDDGDVILETDPSVLAAPAETCHVEHVTMTTDTSSQCDVITTLTRGVQCDDETERVLRRELKAAIDRAKRAESKAVELTVDKANTSMDHDSLSKELAQVRHTVATLKQQAAADRDKLTVQMNECDQTKALLDESERRVESLQMQMKLKDDKCKNECKRALMEVEHEAEVRAREAAATAQAKHDESASQIRQIKADMQELKYTLEDAYAKYAAKEKEVSTLRHDAFLKGSALDSVAYQHKEELGRREKAYKAQEELVQRQFKLTLHEVEMEFRHKQSESILKLKQLTQAFHGAAAEAKQWEGKYRAGLQAEAALNARVQELLSQLQGVDKRLVHLQESCHRSIQEYQATIEELEAALEAEKTHAAALEDEVANASEAAKAVEALERQLADVTATLQVKNIMLDDQAQQIMALRREGDDHRHNEADLREQLRDVELALDESLARQHDMERDVRRVEANVDKLDQWDGLQDELEAKVRALEYIDKEMLRMRKTIAKQEELSQARVQAMQDEHDSAIKSLQASIQQLRHDVSQWEAKCSAMEGRGRSLLEQNRQLQRSVRDHQLRVHTTENEMKVLLQQVEAPICY